MLFVFSVMGQNRFYYGDVNERKAKQVLEKYDRQVERYKNEIAQLESKNDKLLQQFRRSKDGVLLEVIKQKITTNDSLISAYRTKVDQVEFTKEETLETLLGKGRLAYVSSRGNNPEELLAASTAYSSMVYADAYAKRMSEEATTTNSVSKMTGAASNLYFRDAQVIITGPHGFKVENNHLQKKNGHFVFEIPGPGLYTATFLYHKTGEGIAKEVVTKEVTLNPNQASYDPWGGKHDVCFTMFKGY